ncbi:MAG TPA: hypothetical protein P5262_03245 [Candidatus Moranbacteria bacterium]|nr:hypothetical protein [Candidatus Moranbacteria bacterium]
MLTMEEILKCLRKFGHNPRDRIIHPRTVFSKSHRHGEKIIILFRPYGNFFSSSLVVASFWKPPEERSEIEKITCPWQKPF